MYKNAFGMQWHHFFLTKCSYLHLEIFAILYQEQGGLMVGLKLREDGILKWSENWWTMN